jgi:hypothetical protein
MRAQIILAALCGAAASAAFILSCGDDGPAVVDAADANQACDCPAAEAPLAGRMVTVVKQDTLPIGAGRDVTVTCPAGAVLLSGGCEGGNEMAPVLFFSSDGSDTAPPTSWNCGWRNQTGSELMVVARAVCLLPPAQ